MYTFLSFLSFFDGHLGCFHDLPTVNDVVMNLEDVSLRFNINQGEKKNRAMSILLTTVYLEPSIVPGTVQSLNNCLIMNEVKVTITQKWEVEEDTL